jgi:hypothetical protein
MGAMVRLFLCAVACVAVFVGAACGVTWLGGGAFADLDLAGAGRALMAEIYKQDALNIRDNAMRRCVLGKEAVIEDLFADRLSVREAAYEFRRLEGEFIQAVEGDRELLDAAKIVGDDDVSVYMNVQTWAAHAAGQNPARAARLVQIEAEVDALLHGSHAQRA